jgi:hypothetical protein
MPDPATPEFCFLFSEFPSVVALRRTPNVERRAPNAERLNQLSLGEVSHQLGGTKVPRRTIVGVPHAIHKSSELVRSDLHDVADLMAESHAGDITILGGREHGA